MKHLRFILLLLAVGFTQIAFSQDLAKKWEEEDKFKSAIEQVLTEADTEEEACQMGCKTCCRQECVSPIRHVCCQLLHLGI